GAPRATERHLPTRATPARDFREFALGKAFLLPAEDAAEPRSGRFAEWERTDRFRPGDDCGNPTGPPGKPRDPPSAGRFTWHGSDLHRLHHERIVLPCSRGDSPHPRGKWLSGSRDRRANLLRRPAR